MIQGANIKGVRYHCRTTILPPTDQLKDMLIRFEEFHISFLRKYGRNV